MVKLSLSSWLNPSSTTRGDTATAERKKQNRRTFSGFSTVSSLKSSTKTSATNGKAAGLQEKQTSKDSRPSLSTRNSAVESIPTAASPLPNENTRATMATTTTAPSMTALADTISKETAKLEKYLKEKGLPMPSFEVDAADDFPQLPEEMQKSRLEIIHATKQLRDLTVGPRESLRWGVWEVRAPSDAVHTHGRICIGSTNLTCGSFSMFSLCRLSTTMD